MKPLAWLRQRVREAGAGSESDTDRDGAFSYKAESHAFGIGLYYGLRSASIRPSGYPPHPDVQAEKPYFAGGYVVADLLQAALVLATVGTLAVATL
jgi:hypothetical protein